MNCYCCGKPLSISWHAFLEDDDNALVFVGHDCYKRIKATGAVGFKPPKGGPRLFYLKSHAKDHYDLHYGAKS